jgi:hypothetical protein
MTFTNKQINAETKTQKPFNPGRFDGALTEAHYASGWKRAALKNQRAKLIRVLRTKHKNDEMALVLADKLDPCSKGRRCRSGGCPECTSAAQRLLAKTSRKSIKALAGDEDVVCLSIVPDDRISRPTKLLAAETTRRIRRWRDRLGRAGVEWFIGGLDISANSHDADRYPPHWSEHIYGLTVTRDIAKLKKELRKQFPATDAIPRPVKVKLWDYRGRALKYLLKPNAWRRVATDDGVRRGPDRRNQRICRATDKQPLLSRQRVQLALHLDELGLQGRLVLRGCQFLNRGSSTAIVKRVGTAVGAKSTKIANNRLNSTDW